MSNSGFINHSIGENHFVIYTPRDLKSPAPAILFLHGRGESGTDGIKQTAIGLCHAIRMNAAAWPFLVIAPQKPTPDQLWPEFTKRINQALQYAEGCYKIDPHRRYITGLSQGGNGTLELAAALDWQFAAAAPVCGWFTHPESAAKLKNIPVWAFHGLADTVIKPEESQRAVELIAAAGGSAKLTEYPGVAHNSWDKAYQDLDLPAWLLSHSLD
jgi:predicted peptidase